MISNDGLKPCILERNHVLQCIKCKGNHSGAQK